MLANGEPALPATSAIFDDVDPVSALASHPEASQFGVPGDLAGLERSDPCLRDLLQPVGLVVARRQISYHAVAYTRVHAPARAGPFTRNAGRVAARVGCVVLGTANSQRVQGW